MALFGFGSKDSERKKKALDEIRLACIARATSDALDALVKKYGLPQESKQFYADEYGKVLASFTGQSPEEFNRKSEELRSKLFGNESEKENES